MRYLLMLVLGATAFFTHAEAANNQQPDKPTSPSSENAPLGLPPVPIPANNPQTPAKIALGDKLFHDKRFSVDATTINRHSLMA